ncbi:MAG: TolC family protein [Verrucomicrobiota bacterium]
MTIFPPRAVAACGLAFCLSIFGEAVGQDIDDPAAVPQRKVVIVRGTPSWYFDGFVERTRRELETLSEGVYDVEFSEVEGDGDSVRIESALEDAVADPETDLVLAAGYTSTRLALAMEAEKRVRPILGGAVEFSEQLESLISAEGTSEVPNYTFIANPQRLSADFDAFKSLVGVRTIYAVVDRRLFQDLSPAEVRETQTAIERKYQIDIRLIPVGNSVGGILGSIPPAAKAVYVSILPQLAPPARKRLFEAMADRGLLTFSMRGVADVALGALAGQAPDSSDAIAKRAALNSHQILLGIDPASLPVYLPVEDRLTLNLATAKRAGWSPDYETILTANFLNGREVNIGESLTLEKAMRLARDGNADVIIQREQLEIANGNLGEARSFQRPTVNLNLEQTAIDYSDRINTITTPDRLSAGAYGVQLRQSLFNNDIRSNLGAAREKVGAERLSIRSFQLDAMESAGIAFLNYLTAAALTEIQRDNLRLSENNLQLAKLRVSIGAVEQTETFRWEQDAAANRADVFLFEADREQARIELNRILGQPRNKRWSFEDIELSDGDTYFMNDILRRYLNNADDVDRFGEFLKETAEPASPELASFDYGLAAQGILLKRVERSFFLPEVSGFFGLDRIGQGTELIDYTTQGEVSGGIALSFPIYEGGLRKAEFVGQKAVVRQLEAQREQALQFIEQRALSALFGLASEQPNIRLSRRALEAARKNYDAIRDKYSQGAASILDLLDAQAALLGQRQQEALAVYAYLSEVVRMQRAVAWFEFEKSEHEKHAWENMLGTYMRRQVLEVPEVVRPPQVDPDVDRRAAAAIVAAGEEVPPPGLFSKKKQQPRGPASPPPLRAEPIESVPSAESPRKKSGGILRQIFQKQP